MRWKPTKPEDGEIRIVRRFLFLPKTLRVAIRVGGGYGPKETRWLEWANIERVYSDFGYSTDLRWAPQETTNGPRKKHALCANVGAFIEDHWPAVVYVGGGLIAVALHTLHKILN